MNKKSSITIRLCIRNNIDYAREWIIKMCLFNPTEMKLKHYKKGHYTSYNQEKFMDEIYKEEDTNDYRISLQDMTNCINSFMNINSKEVAILSAILDYDIFIKNEEKIYSLVNDIMTHVGIVGRISSLEDNFWQNNIEVAEYKRNKKSLFGVPLKPHPIFKGEKAVDVEKMPGYEEQIANIWFGSAWKMWFNSSYYQYVSEAGIANFEACYSNEKISDSCRCITLYENVLDYEKRENRRRQWDFKKAIKFEETVKVVKEKSVSKYNDPHMEISNGQFEHGGVKLFTVYLDDNNNSVTKSKASKMKIVEYDQAGNVVWQNEVK